MTHFNLLVIGFGKAENTCQVRGITRSTRRFSRTIIR